MIRNALRADADRLWADVMALAEITEPGRPFMRRSFSPLFLEGRAWLTRAFESAGLACRLDAAGNLIARLEGLEPRRPAILLGSHSDTVPDGGRFDGIAGVLAGLEALRILAESGERLRHPVELVDFLAEEPSEFGLSCIGSRGMAGRLEPAHLASLDPAGERLDHAIDRIGGHSATLASAERHDVAAFFELHIEQGVVLEQDGIAIGLVDAIAGITRTEIVFSGRADHAGTTPMDRRQDAAVAAGAVIGFVAARARQLSDDPANGHVAATVGLVEIKPNASNVIPQTARLVVDLRVSQRAVADAFMVALHGAATDAAVSARVAMSRFDILSDTHPVACDPHLQALLGEAASALDLSARRLVSGAGHDTALMAGIAPAAMIFIPCRDGRSHAPEEWAEPDAIARGASVLAHAVLARDAEE